MSSLSSAMTTRRLLVSDMKDPPTNSVCTRSTTFRYQAYNMKPPCPRSISPLPSRGLARSRVCGAVAGSPSENRPRGPSRRASLPRSRKNRTPVAEGGQPTSWHYRGHRWGETQETIDLRAVPAPRDRLARPGVVRLTSPGRAQPELRLDPGSRPSVPSSRCWCSTRPPWLPPSEAVTVAS